MSWRRLLCDGTGLYEVPLRVAEPAPGLVPPPPPPLLLLLLLLLPPPPPLPLLLLLIPPPPPPPLLLLLLPPPPPSLLLLRIWREPGCDAGGDVVKHSGEGQAAATRAAL